MPVEFENKVTTGTLWTVLATVISVAGGAIWGWNQMQAQIDTVAARIETMEDGARDRRATIDTSIAGLVTITGGLDSRTRSLEIQASGFGADLRNIQDGVNDIKASLARLAQQGKP